MYREIDLTGIRIAGAKTELELYAQVLEKTKDKKKAEAIKKEIEATENKLALIEKEPANIIKLLANGATPYLYTNAFKQDLLLGVRRNQAKVDSQNYEEAEKASFVLIDIGTKAAYIMNRQAENASLSKLSEGDFLKWLEQFSANTFINDDLQGAIFEVLFDDMGESSTSKNS